MNKEQLIKQAYEQAAIKVHVEHKDDWHAWLKNDGARSCFVCGLKFREDEQE